jgi:hypothetical protein
MTTSNAIPVPINSAKQDATTERGVRISLPCYIDVPTHHRKELLNNVRRVVEAESSVYNPKTKSGITVVTSQPNLSNVEQYLGMSLSILRSILFQRGGLALDLVLRLQEVAGYEVISNEELAQAFDARKSFCTNYTAEYPFSRC